MGGPCLVDGESREELDNFLVCEFTLDGLEWSSAEQYFQAAKFPSDPGYRERIRAARDGNAAWSLGNTRAVKLRNDWEWVKVDVMYQANRAKFAQNSALAAVLAESQGPITAFGFPFWAKWNAVLLERIRAELRLALGVGDADVNSAELAIRTAWMDDYAAAARARNRRAMDAAGPPRAGAGGSGVSQMQAGGVPIHGISAA